MRKVDGFLKYLRRWEDHFKEFITWSNTNLKAENNFILIIYGEETNNFYDKKCKANKYSLQKHSKN